MDVRLVQLAEGQGDLVAGWPLHALGWTRAMIEQRVRDHRWRVIHAGVYALAHSPLTRRQRWIAAVLSAPGTVLGHDSAGACHGFRAWEASYETVTRPGSGGPRWMGSSLLVARSTTLEGQVTRTDGIPVVTAARALVDLAPSLKRHQLGRGFRESIRLKTTTANEISKILCGQRGTSFLVDLCDRYATIPYHRCRSDAESRGLEVLHDGEVAPPKVNIRIRAEEADLVWRKWRPIIEIDGPQFHLFADEDARKQEIWEDAGYTVRRIPSQDVYDHPERLLHLVNVQMYRP
jgi:very-short-patch-repair endonuclease